MFPSDGLAILHGNWKFLLGEYSTILRLPFPHCESQLCQSGRREHFGSVRSSLCCDCCEHSQALRLNPLKVDTDEGRSQLPSKGSVDTLETQLRGWHTGVSCASCLLVNPSGLRRTPSSSNRSGSTDRDGEAQKKMKGGCRARWHILKCGRIFLDW